jgi:hypothetical protein
MATKKKPVVLKASRAPERPGPPVPEAFIGHESATMMSEETFEEFEARMKRREPAKDEKEDSSTNTSPALDPDELTREAPVDPHELPPDEEPAPENWDDGEDPPTGHDDDEDFLPPEA